MRERDPTMKAEVDALFLGGNEELISLMNVSVCIHLFLTSTLHTRTTKKMAYTHTHTHTHTTQT